MPEVAEVAHACALLRRNILNYRISNINYLVNDTLLFPQLKISKEPEKELKHLEQSLLNSTIESIGRHGKYFWLRLTNPNSKLSNVLLMHFGMTGMIRIRNVKSHLVFMENGGDKKLMNKLEEIDNVNEEEEWPPKYSKFELELRKGESVLQLAFTDPRRLGRIRLLSGENVQTNEGLLNSQPLAALGPDYSKPVVKVESENEEFVFGDPDSNPHGRPRLSLHDFNKLVLSKKKAIKSLLLEQAFFAGVGNWVGDEVIFHAKIHPSEILSSKISYDPDLVDPVVEKLYHSLIYVCEEAVKVEGDVKQFPSHWLMIHRWGKARKKTKSMTSDGLHLDHMTVGGRTSCYCPELQKMLPKLAKDQPDTKRRKIKTEG